MAKSDNDEIKKSALYFPLCFLRQLNVLSDRKSIYNCVNKWIGFSIVEAAKHFKYTDEQIEERIEHLYPDRLPEDFESEDFSLNDCDDME
ncbi:hypothetical protein ACFL6I_14470, partial [candidate division KSB1 bacterium]